MLPPLSPEQVIERIVREEWGRILSALVKRVGDLQLAEDCLQDAVLAAMQNWAQSSLPRAPDAWLITVARRKAIDRIRRDRTHIGKQALIAPLIEMERQTGPGDIEEIPDKRLEMIFTCCHPALSRKSQIALTLRTLGGLTTEEIAGAFLDRPAAMAQRLVRAKKKIALAGIRYQVPDQDMLPERLSAVLRVIYLIFNEGYAARSGASVTRTRLTDEAIRLALANVVGPDGKIAQPRDPRLDR